MSFPFFSKIKIKTKIQKQKSALLRENPEKIKGTMFINPLNPNSNPNHKQDFYERKKTR